MTLLKKKNSGFTVLEVLTAVGIFAFITLAVYGTLTTGRKACLIGEALVTVQESARIALAKITRELHQSAASQVLVGNNSVSFDIPIDADGDGSIDIVPGSSLIAYGADDTGDADGDGIFWEAGWRIEFLIDANNQQIIRRVLDNAGNEITRQVTASDITGLVFQTETGGIGVPNEAVIVGITSQVNNIQGRAIVPPTQITLNTRVKLRN